MSIFHTNHHTDSALRYVSEAAQTPVPEALVESARDRVWQRLQASIAREYETGAWWQRSVALPLPVIAAASVLFLVMAVGLVLNPGVLSNQSRSVADFGRETPVNVQVQVNGNESDLLMRWLEDQNQVGNVTIQLPESAEFQLRGEPVLLRPEPRDEDGDQQLEIVPMESSAE